MGFDVLTIFQRKDMKPVDGNIGLYIKSESKEETYEVRKPSTVWAHCGKFVNLTVRPRIHLIVNANGLFEIP